MFCLIQFTFNYYFVYIYDKPEFVLELSSVSSGELWGNSRSPFVNCSTSDPKIKK